MRNIGPIWMLATVCIGFSLTDSRGDEKITPALTPKPVLKAFKEKFPGARIKLIVKDEIGGKATYEIESKWKEMDVDAILDAEGNFLEIDEQIKLSKLPVEVSAALKTKYPGTKLVRAAEVLKEGKTVYEVVVDKSDSKSLQITLDKMGKVLEVEKLGGND